ncbi:hypothetical protein CSPAE12_02267 [Colletotrichum incanum]|nr:hypothetical protein CSPAE12_02267 [Colletotrichum incanum]
MYTVYHKGYRKTSEYRPIHRFLPARMGRILILYLSMVRPFVNALSACNAIAADKSFASASAYLWPPTFLVPEAPIPVVGKWPSHPDIA